MLGPNCAHGFAREKQAAAGLATLFLPTDCCNISYYECLQIESQDVLDDA